MNRFCELCNSELYLNHDNVSVCPKCVGIKPLSYSASLEICKKLIQKSRTELYIYSSFFSLEYLTELGCWLRESDVNRLNELFFEYNLGRVVMGTLLIKKTLNGWHGETNIDPIITKEILGLDPQNEILRNLRDLVQLRYNLILIEEEYGLFFGYNDLLKFKTEMKYEVEDQDYTFMTNMSWLDYRNNLEEFNITSKDKIESLDKRDFIKKRLKEIDEIDRGDVDEFKKLKEKINYILFESCYNGLNYVFPDPEMFSFKEIKDNIHVLDFLKELYSISRERKDNDNLFFRMPKAQFFEVANKYNYDSSKLYDMFVSLENDFKNFPLLIEINEKIILCPETIFLVCGFLTYKFNKETINTLLSGFEFEDMVSEKFKTMGFSIEDPNNPKLTLQGRKTKNGKREIDLIAYDNENIWVIECKDQGLWKLDPKILWENRKEYRIKDIKKEIKNKHLERVQFVKENYNSYFGFKKDYNIHGIIITRIKENIEIFEDIHILPAYKLSSEKLKLLE